MLKAAKLCALGLTNPQICERMGWSAAKAKHLVRRARLSLGFKSRKDFRDPEALLRLQEFLAQEFINNDIKGVR